MHHVSMHDRTGKSCAAVRERYFTGENLPGWIACHTTSTLSLDAHTRKTYPCASVLTSPLPGIDWLAAVSLDAWAGRAAAQAALAIRSWGVTALDAALTRPTPETDRTLALFADVTLPLLLLLPPPAAAGAAAASDFLRLAAGRHVCLGRVWFERREVMISSKTRVFAPKKRDKQAIT